MRDEHQITRAQLRRLAQAFFLQHLLQIENVRLHQIIVHPRESYLTAGVGASVGEHNAYVYDTLKPPWRDTVQGSFVGLRGLDRLPNPYTVPGSDVPLFHVSLPLPGSNEPFISF